jgi:hypothetical protein
MSVVEQMAKAAYEKWIEGVESLEPHWDALPQSHRDRLTESQRAAVLAMREPTQEMIDAGWYEGAPISLAYSCYQAMVDAALGEWE